MTPTQSLLLQTLAFLALIVAIATPFALCIFQNQCN